MFIILTFKILENILFSFGLVEPILLALNNTHSNGYLLHKKGH
jgi:hypothetical protein